MASSVADFSPLLKGRMERRLRYLTTDDTTQGATLPAIDDDVLGYAIQDAIGYFRLNARRDPDHTNFTDLAIMVKWTIARLGTYKALSGINITQERNEARLESIDLRNSMTPGPTTNNETSRSDRTNGGNTKVYPDSDRRNFHGYLPRSGRGRRYSDGGSW